MIELPEAVTIAGQMQEALAGKRIVSATQGQTPHKWVFTNHTPEEFAQRLPGRAIERVTAENKYTLSWLEGGLVLIIGDMGGRILLHPQAGPTPKKHHFLMVLDDGSSLSVAVQGWGFVQFFPADEVPAHHCHQGLSPLSQEFNAKTVAGLLDDYAATGVGSAKAFLVQRPLVNGIGNGYCQDILFRAGLHPRRKVSEMTVAERKRLFPAMRDTLKEATRLGGRDTERDLFGQPGRYVPLLDKRTKGKPCPICNTPIEVISYLGGSCYFCPNCQPLD